MWTNTPRRASWLAYACSIAVACVAVAACGADGGGASTGTGGGARADGFPVTIQNCGRTLTFDRPPFRVRRREQLQRVGRGQVIEGLQRGGEKLPQRCAQPQHMPSPVPDRHFEHPC